ncbi:MAG: efflux RND transporter periplasmic adaptor subunit, partial [Candidatus Eremiobacteraeota bacterium]|nr:efflux RND transporter periplasmic adaptor subunit [Candidatus Eremiobacteraeota bacterium]
MRPTLSIAGVIAPLQNVGISSSLSEPADSVLVKEGDTVGQGQVLAVLDTADLRAQLAADEQNVEAAIRTAAANDAKVTQAQYQARLSIGQGGNQVSSARAAVTQARQTLAQAQSDLARDQQLVGQGYISAQQVQQQQTVVRNDAQAVAQAEASLQSSLTNEQVNGNGNAGLQAANVASARADAAASHAQVDQARATSDQVRTQIAKATITSPVDGVIVNRNLNEGEYPGGRTIFTIQQVSHVYAMLNASSADVFKIRQGSPATVTVSGTSGAAYRGDVVAVLGQVTPGATNFTVKIDLANPDARLVSGLPVTGTIDLPSTTGIAIPTSAFLDDTHTSLIAPRNGVARELHVREVASDGTTSIVAGLQPGDTIVANGQLGLTPGT